MDRVYPSQPIVGVLAVVQRGDRFLLVQRAKAPNRGLWGFPGGVQELGETVAEAAFRELAEETGVGAQSPRVLTTLDVIERDDESARVRYHYTLIAVHLAWHSGEGVAADDAEALGWFRIEDLESLAALPAVGPLMLEALALPATAAA